MKTAIGSVVCLTLLCVQSAGATPASQTYPPTEEMPLPPKAAIADLACLAEAVYFEAGGSTLDGKAAVAHVVLNRARDPRFPGTLCDVVSEGEGDGPCQFSYRCTLDTSDIKWPDSLEAAREVAKAVLTQRIGDPTDGALFFHADFMEPGWFATLDPIGNFGGNIFYK